MSATGTAAPPVETLDSFLERGLALLESRSRRRSEQARTWGEGSDDVNLIDDGADGPDAPDVLAARAWQARKLDAGFGWVTGPPELGGAGLPTHYETAFKNLEAGFDLPDPSILAVTLHMVLPTVVRWASAQLRDALAPRLARAETVSCQLFSEPEAGSDLAGIRTSAVRDGGDWVVNGQKIWTSGAHFSDIGLIVCRTDPDGPRYRNLTAFIVDMHDPGVEVRPIRQLTGHSSFNEVFLTDVRIPDTHRLGEPGQGWAVIISTLMSERSSIGTGNSTKTVDPGMLLELVRRHGDGSALTRDLTARAYTASRLVERFGERCAEELRSGSDPGPRFSIGKILLVDALRRTSELIEHVLGPRIVADTGEWGTFAWSIVSLEQPSFGIGGGTDEIQRNIVAERVLGLPKDRS
ncbi:acyl-CoA dehydrogenase family protein [Pseudonocardia lacus]|uniref:acyl-CoA dehydrogenase family protein n=1 Tax=Pseudonocardia lacus TaxID=2835865 RepID=UPI001BDD1C4A|nr:acyl-CoA dehydrogenase family protein [Pseudonocardia lacus]